MVADNAYMVTKMELSRHIRACNNAVLPGVRWRVFVGGHAVGWALPALADAAAEQGGVLDAAGLHLPRDGVAAIARALAAGGRYRWRDEPFDVRPDGAGEGDGPVLAQIDRGALPSFGIGAIGVHVNGLVGDRLWVARRARSKPLDPGKLDHIVAGGVASGDTIAGTVVKEAGEEAGLPADLAARATSVGLIRYAAERDEGLRRDTLHCFDLELPPEFQPVATDGEVEAFELWPLPRVLDAVRRTDEFKFNVNLVLIDLFIRRGLVRGTEAEALAEGLRGTAR